MRWDMYSLLCVRARVCVWVCVIVWVECGCMFLILGAESKMYYIFLAHIWVMASIAQW